MNDIWRIAITFLYFGLLFTIVEVFNRTASPAPEIRRKLLHATSAAGSASLVWWLTLDQIAFTAACFVVFMIVQRQLNLLSASLVANRRTYGDLFFPAGIGVAALLASYPDQYVFAVALVGICDTAAALVGQRCPVRHVAKLRMKSVGGLIAYVASGAALALFYLAAADRSFGVLAAAVAVGASAIVEMLSPQGSDNLTISAVALVALRFV